MAVRTFTRPTSLNESLATATAKMTGAEANGAPRSEASARDSTQSFPSEAKNPLKHSGAKDSKPGITFAHEGKLPKLPIPELESSCTKYLAALKPLQTPREHQETIVAVQDFLKQDGPALQEKLKKYAADKGNYIEQFCKSLSVRLGPLSSSTTAPTMSTLALNISPSHDFESAGC